MEKTDKVYCFLEKCPVCKKQKMCAMLYRTISQAKIVCRYECQMSLSKAMPYTPSFL